LWLRNVRGQECPACGEAYDIIKAVQRAMGDDLRFVFRYSPLSEAHPHEESDWLRAHRRHSRAVLDNPN
jgi:hypothetical protein